MSTCSSSPLHIAIFPFLSRSHMPALLDLAIFLSSKGLKTSIITTPANSHHFLPFPSIHLLPFPLETQDLSLLPPHLSPSFLSAIDSLSSPLSSLLSSLKPDALISDVLYHWAPSLAKSHNIPHIAFNIIGVFPSCAITHLSKIHHEDLSTLPFFIPNFPYHIQIENKSQLPEVLNHPFMLNLYLKAERESHAVLYNSFYDLERECKDQYRQMGPTRKVLLVGPTCLLGKVRDTNDAVKSVEPGARDPILEWLDGKGEGSVLYVSFGTTCQFEGPQLHELALGLEASGAQFIWVVRNNKQQDDDTWMPQGYEERISNRSLIIRNWAPQREILAHKAIGGFMSHCGWNSIIETVCTGIPIATWPLGSEQFLNERFIVEVLKIGVEVRPKDQDDNEGLIRKEEVVKAVRELMAEGPQKEERRRIVKEIAELGRRAVEEGGSSIQDLNCLIEDLYTLRNERSKTSTK